MLELAAVTYVVAGWLFASFATARWLNRSAPVWHTALLWACAFALWPVLVSVALARRALGGGDAVR